MLPTGVWFLFNSAGLPEKALPRESTFATVIPTTLFAPACFKARAHASRVAPVVNT